MQIVFYPVSLFGFRRWFNVLLNPFSPITLCVCVCVCVEDFIFPYTYKLLSFINTGVYMIEFVQVKGRLLLEWLMTMAMGGQLLSLLLLLVLKFQLVHGCLYVICSHLVFYKKIKIKECSFSSILSEFAILVGAFTSAGTEHI